MALKRVINLSEAVGDPDEGYCVVHNKTLVVAGPFVHKADAIVKQHRLFSLDDEKYTTASLVVKFGKIGTDGEFVATRAVSPINEGPFDYIKGAARQIAPAMQNVARAGQQTSAIADLTKSVKLLIQLIQKQASTQPQQTTPPQYQQPGTSAQAAGTTQQLSPNVQPTFASYLYNLEGERLDEGVWDALKRGASAISRGIGGAARAAVDPDGPVVQALHNKFANDPWLTNAVKAAAKHTRPATPIEQQKQQIVQQIIKILQRVHNPKQTLKKILGQVAGNGGIANQVYAMIYAQQTPPPPSTPRGSRGSKAGWQQSFSNWQPGSPSAPRQQPARTYGPGKRRPRPTVDQS